MHRVDLASVRAEIEDERQWREAEIRVLKNHVEDFTGDIEQGVARKAIVVMLYAHFEGLTRGIFGIYVTALNALGLKISDAHSSLAASALHEIFHAMRDPHSKCKVFSRALPDDSKLHRYARELEFLERTTDFGSRLLDIGVDDIVDTKSNLTPTVLRTILYRLGFDPKSVDPWEASLNQLLRRRNDVAHGSMRRPLSAKDVNELETAITAVIEKMVLCVSEAISNQLYLATTAGRPHGLSAPAPPPVASGNP